MCASLRNHFDSLLALRHLASVLNILVSLSFTRWESRLYFSNSDSDEIELYGGIGCFVLISFNLGILIKYCFVNTREVPMKIVCEIGLLDKENMDFPHFTFYPFFGLTNTVMHMESKP